MALQHLRSSTANKRPLPAGMSDGQLAINTNNTSPGLFFKNSAGALVKVGPVHVGATAPNASPAGGGETGNSVGEQWLDTSGTNPVLKIWDGSTWQSEAGEFVNASGDTMTGALVMDNQQQVRFRETTANGTNYIAIQAPASVSADRTLTLPDVSGTLISTGDTGTVTSTMIADGTIVNADVNASAAIAGTKISPDFGSQNVTTTGTATAASLIPSSSTVPTNGVYLPAANTVGISTGGSGRLFVDANGRVLTGTSTALNVNGTSDWQQQIAAAGPIGILLSRFSNNTGPARINLLKSRSGSIGSNTIVSNGDVAGAISFLADDGTDYTGSVGEIKAEIDGVPGTGSLPGRIVFSTTPSGTNGVVERLRITSAGLVGVGTSSPQDILHLSSAGNLYLRVTNTSTGINAYLGQDSNGTYIGNTGAADVRFIQGAAERMRLTSTGLGIGSSSPRSNLDITKDGAVAAGNWYNLAHITDSAGNKGFQIGYDNTSQTSILAASTTGTASNLQFYTYNGSSWGPRATITSGGSLGIGNTVPISSVHLGVTSTEGNARIAIQNSTVNTWFGLANTNDRLTFERWNGSIWQERMALDNNGRLLVGTSSSRGNFYNTTGADPLIQLETTSAPRLSVVSSSSAADFPGQLILGHQLSGTVGGNTVVTNNAELGLISFQGSDGSEFVQAANIAVQVDGTPGANDMPGRLVFSTTADGASSPTERMRITNAGYVAINGTGTIGGIESFLNVYHQGATTYGVIIANTSSVTGNAVTFRNTSNNVTVGSITHSTSATAYNTSSDYRLKENIVPLTGAAARLAQLPVHRFNFISDPGRTVDGFIAHEVQDVVPEAITGEKDAVDEEGNPIYQGIDQSKLVPLLTAALQEAIGEIEALKARVAALESA